MNSQLCAHPGVHASGPRGARTRILLSDSGMSTLETALMVPVLLTVTFLFLSIIGVGMQALSLSDSTRTAARELARGASPESVVAIFTDREPEARISLEWSEATVTVRTEKPARVLSSVMNVLPWTLTQTQTAPREWVG